jgi:hypothetical protein
MSGGAGKKNKKKRRCGDSAKYEAAWRATKAAKGHATTCRELLHSCNDELRETHNDEAKLYSAIKKRATALKKDSKANNSDGCGDRLLQRAIVIMDEMAGAYTNLVILERGRARSHHANMTQFDKLEGQIARAKTLNELAKETCQQKTMDPISVLGVKGNVTASSRYMPASWLIANVEDENGYIRPGLLTQHII